jgi:hypothetical protein
MTESSTRFVYYGALTPGRTGADPAGVVRRSLVDGHPLDEAFTRSLRWEPTLSLRDEELGRSDVQHVEITEAEAMDFVEKITTRQRS